MKGTAALMIALRRPYQSPWPPRLGGTNRLAQRYPAVIRVGAPRKRAAAASGNDRLTVKATPAVQRHHRSITLGNEGLSNSRARAAVRYAWVRWCPVGYGRA